MIAQRLLPEWDLEMTTTRKLLERVPTDRFDWKPHDKSYSLGQLALHVAEIPSYASAYLAGPELNFVPNPNYLKVLPADTAGLLEKFDGNVAAARAAIEQASDDDYMAEWTFRSGDHIIFTVPRIGAHRGFVMNHLIHHRGQLSVYLRLLEIPVPGIYGPSADEPNF